MGRLTRPDNNRRGGEDGDRDQGSAERPPGASGTLQLLQTPLPLLPAVGFLPSVLIRLTTSLLATRPGSAGATAQQIAVARDPSGPSAEHARAPRLPSASREAGRARALRERAPRYSWSVGRRLQFRLRGWGKVLQVLRLGSWCVELACVMCFVCWGQFLLLCVSLCLSRCLTSPRVFRITGVEVEVRAG